MQTAAAETRGRQGRLKAPLAVLSLGPGSGWMSASPGASFPGGREHGPLPVGRPMGRRCLSGSLEPPGCPCASTLDLSCRHGLQEGFPGGEGGSGPLRSDISVRQLRIHSSDSYIALSQSPVYTGILPPPQMFAPAPWTAPHPALASLQSAGGGFPGPLCPAGSAQEALGLPATACTPAARYAIGAQQVSRK